MTPPIVSSNLSNLWAETRYNPKHSMSAMEYNDGFDGPSTTISSSNYFVEDMNHAPSPPVWVPRSKENVQIDAELWKSLGDTSTSEKPQSTHHLGAVSGSFRDGESHSPPHHKHHRRRYSSSRTHYETVPDQKHRRNRSTTSVTDFFLEEAKLAQEKAESLLGVSTSPSSKKKIGRIRNGVEFRQVSSSSDEAVAPSPRGEALLPHARVPVFDDAAELPRMGPTYAMSNSKQPLSRKLRGLSYTLRRTDSSSTFQSLDGLKNSYPLIRKDAKKRKEERYQASEKKNKENRHKSGRSRSRQKSSDRGFVFDSSTFACFATSCFPMDDIVPTVSLSRRTASSSQRNKSIRDSPEKSKATRDELLRLQSQLRELRSKASHGPGAHLVEETAEKSVVVDVKQQRKTVRFATPLVTKTTYRPYTPQSEIAVLYFQEEELEELEFDRETVSGDQFECQYDEVVMTVSIAYQKQGPSDE